MANIDFISAMRMAASQGRPVGQPQNVAKDLGVLSPLIGAMRPAGQERHNAFMSTDTGVPRDQWAPQRKGK
jgi:hypothetical protein